MGWIFKLKNRMKRRFKKGTKELSKVEKKHRKKIIFTIIIAALTLIIISTKLYLYLNLLLGNDIVIHLDTDTEHILLKNGEVETVEFKASITTNPFCKAQCGSQFIDISTGEIVDSTTFSLRPGNPHLARYDVASDTRGEGQKIYRFHLECQSIRSGLCHTSEETTTRIAVVTVDHILNTEEIKAKTEAGKILPMYAEEHSQSTKKLADETSLGEKLSERTGETIEIDPRHVTLLGAQLRQAREHWKAQEYLFINLEELNETLAQPTGNQITATVAKYNAALTLLFNAEEKLDSLPTETLNFGTSKELTSTVEEFNTYLALFESASPLQVKHAIADSVTTLTNNISDIKFSRMEKLSEELSDAYNILCSLNLSCHTPVLTSASTICEEQQLLTGIYANLSNNKTYTAEELANFTTYLNAIIGGTPSKIYPAEDAIQVKVRESLPPCNVFPVVPIQNVSLSLIQADKTLLPPPLVFLDPLPVCCLQGECTACCDSCNEPLVIFLHGHAFNKDTSAEYSLDAFNKIQERLEQEGIVNMGTISLYTERTTPYGTLGRIQSPMSIKTSYYFDIFKEPENYLIVQTKSENVDTYAIRLKELMDTITYKTGRKKVIIVSHSMGGLVARRYIQLFREGNVEKLIMIGTPNYGIEGTAADFCSIIGEKLECRDMEAGSLFLNKLNRELSPVETHVIVGTGCDMDGADGDGVVTRQNAELEGATAYTIPGTCSTFQKLHTKLLNIDAYPEVYDTLLTILQS